MRVGLFLTLLPTCGNLFLDWVVLSSIDIILCAHSYCDLSCCICLMSLETWSFVLGYWGWEETGGEGVGGGREITPVTMQYMNCAKNEQK